MGLLRGLKEAKAKVTQVMPGADKTIASSVGLGSTQRNSLLKRETPHGRKSHHHQVGGFNPFEKY